MTKYQLSWEKKHKLHKQDNIYVHIHLSVCSKLNTQIGIPKKRDPCPQKDTEHTTKCLNNIEDFFFIMLNYVNPPMQDLPSENFDLLENSTFKEKKNKQKNTSSTKVRGKWFDLAQCFGQN